MIGHKIHGMTLGMPHCWGIFGSGDKVQSTTNTQVGASEDAQQAYGAQSQTAKDDAVVLGGYGNRNVIGNDASQGQGIINQGALAIGGYGNNLSNAAITVGYDAAQFQNALQSVGSNLSNALNSQSAAGQSTLNSVLDRISTLAENRQTDGDSSRNKIVLWIVLGVLALVGFVFTRKK